MEEDGERNGLARMPGITRSRDSGEQALREPHSRERLRCSLGSAPRGLPPPPRRAGRGRTDTQAPHDGGPPACKDKRMLFVSTCPARTGVCQPVRTRACCSCHCPAWTGVRPETVSRDTPAPREGTRPTAGAQRAHAGALSRRHQARCAVSCG